MAIPSVSAGKGIWHIFVIATVAMVIYYMLTRHPAYAFAVVPYVSILACLAMHLIENSCHLKSGHREAANAP